MQPRLTMFFGDQEHDPLQASLAYRFGEGLHLKVHGKGGLSTPVLKDMGPAGGIHGQPIDPGGPFG